MSVLEGLEEVSNSLREEGCSLKQTPILFLGKEEYYTLVKSLKTIERGANGHPVSDEHGGAHFGIDLHTINCTIKIFNKDELYRLTNVIDRITKD